MLSPGTQAPDFSLPNQLGQDVTLSELVGQRTIVLFFYPKDAGQKDTLEACAFRDNFKSFEDAQAVLLGISSDSVASHRSFSAANHLPFMILSDADNAVRKAYHARRLLIFSGRVTYVIDKQGVIRFAYSDMSHPREHMEQALKAVLELAPGDETEPTEDGEKASGSE